MAVVILKNTTASRIVIDDLGLVINSYQSSTTDYGYISGYSDSILLKDFITNGQIVVNNGTLDLSVTDALLYLGITKKAEVYTKEETNNLLQNINSNFSTLNTSINNNFYTKDVVDLKVANIQSFGINGAVNYFTDLPSSGNKIGDIWIVKMTKASGILGPRSFVVDGQTGLYLPFDTTWQDTLGHPGTKYGTIELVNGAINKAGDFNGTSDYLTFNSSSDFGDGSALTVGGWIYTRRTGTYGIINRWSSYTSDNEGWKIDVHGNRIKVSLDPENGNYWGSSELYSPYDLPLNTWTHIAFTYDNGIITLFINAEPVNALTTYTGEINSTDGPLYIGRTNDNDNAKYLNGLMDDWFIENRVMSRAELELMVFGTITSYNYEGFYQWNGSEWIFLSRNTGEDAVTITHNNLLGINSGDYQHLTQIEKDGLTQGLSTELHNHNNLYYNKTEVAQNFAAKDHVHSQYYTSSVVDSLMNGLTYSKISTNDPNTNVTATELETLTNGSNADGLHSHNYNSLIEGKGLDHAYDNHTTTQAGVGRSINVDSGAVSLNASNGYAPLKLQEINYTPNQSLAGGEICFKNSEMWFRDSTRSKWVGFSVIPSQFSSNSTGVSGYLYYGVSQTNSLTGFSLPWDGVIVGISGRSQNSSNAGVDIYINGSNRQTIYWGADAYDNTHLEADWLNIDFSKDDDIGIYLQNSGTRPNRPCITLYVRRRMI